jgi:hypothetical protein
VPLIAIFRVSGWEQGPAPAPFRDDYRPIPSSTSNRINPSGTPSSQSRT